MAHGGAGGAQAVVTCDAEVEPGLWQAMFQRAAASSFEQMALAGAAGPPRTGVPLPALQPSFLAVWGLLALLCCLGGVSLHAAPGFLVLPEALRDVLC
jgi:hypothetical protein